MFFKSTQFTNPVSEIWDKNISTSSTISKNGVEYCLRNPDFDAQNKEEILIVMTLSTINLEIQEEIKQELNQQGFSHVIHYLDLDKM